MIGTTPRPSNLFPPAYSAAAQASTIARAIETEPGSRNGAGGASSPVQLLFRPRVAVNPYATGVRGAYLCSASTPPGAGAHGMCGANAAAQALADLGLPTP